MALCHLCAYKYWDEFLSLYSTKHWWFSGRILACHAGGPGSIPGQCNFALVHVIIILCENFNGRNFRVKLSI